MRNRADLPRFTGPNLTGELQFNYMDRLVRRDLRVARVEDITPRYRRVVLVGDDLADGFPIARLAPDHVRVFFPHPATGELVAPREMPDGSWVNEGGTGDPIHRDYTVRAWNPETRELSLDFVLHGHGFAGRWASRATAGDRLVVNGPSSNWLLPENYSRYLALGDETALPAIARIIAEAPAEAHVTALIEIADAGEEQDLTRAGELDLHWIHRDTAPRAEGHLSALETALRAWRPPADPGTLFAFAAGETQSVKPIRRYLRDEIGLTKDQVVADGYWKRGVSAFDHHDADIDDD